MFQNIKVDIIYYKTATDFEMEFNLSGCCRMRLLTDKAPDRKILVNQLVRAVSRSRIIIITGSLFGDDGIVSTCAKAIGRPLVKVENKQFGITSEEDIEIISEALPLVSTDGIFSGCIVEQGPQTLILLSENKNIRKNVMQNLIHQYIKEVCAAELTEKVEEEPIEEIVEPEIIEEELVAEEEVEIAEELPDIDDSLILDDEEAFEEEEETFSQDDIKLAEAIIDEDEDYLEDAIKANGETIQSALEEGEALVFEEGYINRRQAKQITREYANTLNDENFVTEDDVYDEENPEPPIFGGAINISILIIAAIILVAAALLCYCLFIAPADQGTTTIEQLKETFKILFG